ncbi:MAG: hypothetical protein R3D90_09415 [Paracoccaceae bacterium]
MMMARKVMGALVMGALGAGPALAESVSDNIVAQLETQGYKSVSTERTWLGRTRIIAEGAAGQREIVVNPNNGEILRDMFVEARGSSGMGRQILQTADTSAAAAGGVETAGARDQAESARESGAGINRGGGREERSRSSRGETSRDDRGGRSDAGNGGPGG